MTGKLSNQITLLFAFVVVPAGAQYVPPVAGNGPYVAPLSAAYSELTNAGNAIVSDIKERDVFARATTVIIYDANTFAAMPYYPTAVQQIKDAFGDLCRTAGPQPGLQPRIAIAPLDLAGAASALAALVSTSLPSTIIQGQPVTFDNTALIAAFTASAQAKGLTVLNPVYLLPAGKASELNCTDFAASQSFADLWNGLQARASALKSEAAADEDPIKPALTQYQTLLDSYLSAEKGMPLAAKMLVVESLERAIVDPATAVVTDMRLDAAGVDSTTRTLLWWRKTTFSSTVLAHYSLLSVQGSRPAYNLVLQRSANVNILVQNLNRKKFTPNTSPEGMINPY